MTTYTFSVVATNSIGSGEAGILKYTTPGKVKDTNVCTYIRIWTHNVHMWPNLWNSA